MSEALVEKKKRISPIWILPILAICLGGWLLFKSLYEEGIDITLEVTDSSGIIANKTPVMYKGNPVGIVKKIKIGKNLQTVLLFIEMDKNTAPFLVKDMKFWIERVDVQAGKISGLETLLSGNYIGVQPGVSKEPARSFTALKRQPPAAANAPGLHFKLRTQKFKSLDIGSGIYTQNIKIGTVQDYTLQDDNSVLIDAYIEPEFQHLVKKNSLFWNAGGITISGGITNLKVHITSISSLLNGGIDMDTPPSNPVAALAENGQIFTLYADLDAMQTKNKPTGLTLVLETTDLGSLKIGSPVYYRKVKIGEITEINLSPAFDRVFITVIVYNHYKAIIRQNTRFWNASGIKVSGGVLSGISMSTESLEALLAGGIALATPDNNEMGGPVASGKHFYLEGKAEDSWLKWTPRIGQKAPQKKEKEKTHTKSR